MKLSGSRVTVKSRVRESDLACRQVKPSARNEHLHDKGRVYGLGVKVLTVLVLPIVVNRHS